MLIFHITIAIISLAVISFGLLRPSKSIITTSYGIAAGTILSGTLLAIQTPTQMLHVCVTGLAYLVVASLGLIVLHIRLAHKQKVAL